MTIYTIGHSTRSIAVFTEMLRAFNIEVLADIRSYPGSRRYPQFNKASLSRSLEACGIHYLHFPALGGRREPVMLPKSTKKERSFLGYIEHMKTDEFKAGIKELLETAIANKTAIMCSEGDWHNCHRSIVADHLKSNNIQVIHIMGINESEEHQYTKLYLRVAENNPLQLPL